MNEASIQGCLSLAEAVVKGAAVDYKRGGADRKKEVERFFRSDWGYLLCASINMDAEYILELLRKKGGAK